MSKNSDTFCIMPFIHLHNMSNGLFKMCCLTEIAIVDDFGKSYFVGNQPVFEVWNSNCLKAARKLMVENKKVPVCANCYKIEDAGGKSLRQEYNEQFLSKNIHIVENAKNNDYNVNEFPSFLELRTGNSCNSACRMCNSNDSSLVYIENSQIQKMLKTDPFEAGEGDHTQTIIPDPNVIIFGRTEERIGNSKSNIDVYLDEVITNINKIKDLTLSGGEPFLLEKTTDLLEIIAEKNPTINLQINTNGSIAGERIRTALSKLKNVKLCISIDGYDKVNEYIRYPLKWEKITTNLEKFESLTRDGFYLSVNVTVQIFNSFDLKNIISYFLTNHPNIFLTLTPLTSPLHFNVQTLPRHIKNDLSLFYKNYTAELSSLEQTDNIKNIIQSLNALYTFMRQISMSETDSFYFDCLKSNIKIYDKYRNQNIKEYIPALAKYL